MRPDLTEVAYEIKVALDCLTL